MEMDPFLQDQPQPSNRFRTDQTFGYALERILPEDVWNEVAPALDELGQRAITEWAPLGDRAEANPPRHVPYDAWGRRVDRIEADPAWLELVRIGQEIGLTAIPYEDRFGPHARTVHLAVLDLFGPVSAVADCPLAMTDAAARVLLNEDAELAARYAPLLTARTDGWTSGQWMTEKEGGSDVGRTGTVARQRDDGTWTLHGTKWFTSATTANMSLALARPEGAETGSRGLSLFLLELRNPDGSWNGLTVRRLKDKLGTKAVPTAELDLDGTVATPVGGIGRGVAKIAAMLNITRVHAAMGSLGGIGGVLDLARDYAARREAYGRLLRDLPAHRAWMARIAAEYEAANALTFRAGELLGAVERGGGDPDLTRVVVPLAKMAVCRQGVWVISEVLESFGGAGYLEDTVLPRALRDAHVQCIWEGTTSVMALDVLRALAKGAGAEVFLADVDARSHAFDHPLLEEPKLTVAAAAERLKALLPEASEQGARRLAWGMARTYQAALMIEAAGWALAHKDDARPATAVTMFTAEPLVGPDLPPDEDLAALAFDREA
jgi:alkylation response protein AidB-like acyl-CoA dehydrogenase